MGDKLRLMVTGVAALGVIGLAVSGNSLWSAFDDDDDAPRLEQPAPRLANLKGFDGITLEGPDDVVVTPGSEFSVTTEGDPDAVRLLNLYVRDGVLHVGRHRGREGHSQDNGATVRITMPALSRVWMAGSGNVDVDKVDGKEFNVMMAGSGRLQVEEALTDAVRLTVRGSGEIAMGGNAQELSVNVIGSGNVDTNALIAHSANIVVAGSGRVSAHADRDAKLVVTGSGSAQVQGTSQCQIQKIGSGEAECTS